MPGHWELIVLGLVLLLLFGAKRVPLIGRQLGRSVRELKDTVQDVDPRDDMRRAMDAPEDEARAAGTDRRDEPPADLEPVALGPQLLGQLVHLVAELA